MQFKRLRRVFKKQVLKQQKQVESLSLNTEKGLERHLFRRFAHLKPVRRFIVTWVVLIALIIGCLVAQFQHLGGYYQKVQPVAGGIYSEGVLGSISNVNPIFASSEVDRSLSRLVFEGLLRYNAKGNLVPSLAESYDVSTNGRIYTIKLKPGLSWHDGKPLTSADVVFTFTTIKNPEARSPLFNTWQNVTVAAPDSRTVVFTLPGSLAVFPQYLTTGIVPEHLLGNIAAGNLRSASFNTRLPIGAGPFAWHGLQVSGNDPSDIEEQVALVPFDKYVGGKPKLNEFIMRAFASEDRLKQTFADGQLTAVAGLNAVPDNAPSSTVSNDLLLAAGTYVFFKTTAEPLSSVKVRQALVAAANQTSIIDSLPYMTRPVNSPLLAGQLAYDKRYTQKTNDIAVAQRLLAEDGWVAGPDGILAKNGTPLSFALVAADTPEYRQVAKELRKQWKAVGVNASVQLLSSADYNMALAGHEYDATLYGISIGDDPDVYAFWHSSQADVRSNTRLNLSEWKNATADSALEAGRTRFEPALRAIKYAPFLQAWQQDAPALGLYQPRYLYLTRGSVYGLTERSITGSINRYNGVENWQIRTARTTVK